MAYTTENTSPVPEYDAAPIKQNSTIGSRYTVDHKISSCCWTGHDNKTGEKLIIKSLRLPNLKETANIASIKTTLDAQNYTNQKTCSRQQFLTSSLLLKFLKGIKGIPEYVDLVWDRELPYLIMKYIEGSTLSAAIGYGCSWHEIKHVIAELLRILHQVHQAGVVHLDIHTQNVLITPQKEIMLIDFGSAQQLIDGQAYAISVNGAFTPPQQGGAGAIYSEGNGGLYTPPSYPSPVTVNADLYAVGTVMRKLLDQSGLHNITEYTCVEEFIHRSTAPFPGNRFQSADRMLSELNLIPDSVQPFSSVQTVRESIHEIIHFGRYPQYWKNGNPCHDSITWVAYPGEPGTIRLVSRQILDYQAFKKNGEFCCWQDSDIRIWLNTVFLKNAFNPAEQKLLLPAYVINGEPSLFSSEQMLRYDIHSVKCKDSGCKTPDYVFLSDGKDEIRDMTELCGETVYASWTRSKLKCNGYELTGSIVDGRPSYPCGPVIYDEENKQQFYKFGYPAGIRPVIVVPSDFEKRYLQMLRESL